MNKQNKGNGNRGIEWTDFTSGPIGGCFHDCQWKMPDEALANCYAEDVANAVARAAYPQGFRHHYWRPEEIEMWYRLKTPAKIFVGSMADVFGRWVPDAQIQAILDGCARASWHSFQFLTKNAPRLEKFHYPPNVWIGVSAPPSFMWGKELNPDTQVRMIYRQMAALAVAKEQGAGVTWMSIEPLSFNIAPHLKYRALDWIVIGAASNGRSYYQPEGPWLNTLLHCADFYEVPVFFKGNLRPSIDRLGWSWREEFPAVKAEPQQMILFET